MRDDNLRSVLLAMAACSLVMVSVPEKLDCCLILQVITRRGPLVATKVSDRSSSYILKSVVEKPTNQIQIKISCNFLRGYHYFGRPRFLHLQLKFCRWLSG